MSLALEARLAWELAALQLPAARWTPEVHHAGHSVADVVIIGGGMSGLTLGAALKHRGLQVDIYDESPEGFEGPWATTARMETLRSPKQLTGPALGIPSLSFRAWFEAQWGAAAWAALDNARRDFMTTYKGLEDIIAAAAALNPPASRTEPARPAPIMVACTAPNSSSAPVAAERPT